MQTEIAELAARLKEVERQNSRLKRSIIVIATVLAALLVVAAKTRPSLPADAQFEHLRVGDLIVRNSSGTELHIWSRDGLPEGVAVDLVRKDALGTHVVGRYAAFSGSGQFSVSRAEEGQSITLMPDEIAQAMLPGAAKGPGIIIRGDAPFVGLADTKKYTAVLGAANLTLPNGSEMNTTASALHLFDEKGHVMWRAPQ
jgi:hypothetical protein